ncbi:MAG TPA: GNAT family N-acetyltransferase [Thermoguttaceae bacterium]|nr:GNAT family N-acetyltransferase [Thermoguttaceae bacterium]
MPQIDVTVTCPVFDSFRVEQVGGMFDVPIAERASERFCLDVPELGSDWRIGLIVGPSASGKSTIARRMFGNALYHGREWPRDRAVVDGLGDRPIREITGLFTAVGFSSPPSWIKPYHVLSGGEQFRCDLARALAWANARGEGSGEKGEGSGEWGEGRQENTCSDSLLPTPNSPLLTPHSLLPVVAFDEFTSVVDRNVARIASAAIAGAVHRGIARCRFVAVTCHYDVTDWLQPDWVIDMATSTFTRRCLPRPPIRLEIFRCRHGAWRLFARHHYLSGSLSKRARCYLAIWEGEPVAFCAMVTLIGQKNRWRISRIVTLPDYQGVGIGTAVMETVAELHRGEGHRVNCTASHPAMIAHWRKSPRWRAVSVKKTGGAGARGFVRGYRGSGGRAVVSAEYVGPLGEPRETPAA